MQQNKTLWLVKGTLSLLCVGAGLSVFGEAVIQKIDDGAWFWWGAASLVLINVGLCMMFDNFNATLQERLRSLERQVELNR